MAAKREWRKGRIYIKKGKVIIMKTLSYTIKDEQGIHARPAGELVKAAKAFTSSIKIVKDGKEGDCKKIFTVMALAVKKDNEVTIRIEGEDEDAAFTAMEKFMKEIL